MMSLAQIAAERLSQAGHQVHAADIPGLWDIDGIARDVTTGQLIDIAQQRVGLIPPAITMARPG
jgi:hypothetical protein